MESGPFSLSFAAGSLLLGLVFPTAAALMGLRGGGRLRSLLRRDLGLHDYGLHVGILNAALFLKLGNAGLVFLDIDLGRKRPQRL